MKKLIVSVLVFAMLAVPTSAFATQSVLESENFTASENFIAIEGNGDFPLFIDGDKSEVPHVLLDGGGMKYVDTKYVRNKQIGVIFNWTSAATVTKSNGFNISNPCNFEVFGITFGITMGWSTSESYTWEKPNGASQFRVVGMGDIKVDRYLNMKTHTHHYVKKTVNKTDVMETK